MTPSLTTLRDALERLELLVGLYAAPVLRDRLASCDDPAEQALIVGLVKAFNDVAVAGRVALGHVTEESAIIVPGRVEREFAALVEREKRWSNMAGYVRGKSDEVAARMSEVCGGPGPRPRLERVTVEPHLKPW
jgi:hypothetical protein